MIPVYHGTTQRLFERIAREGLRPRPGYDRVYVTTDRSAGQKYAQTCALHYLREHGWDGVGVLVSMWVHRAELTPDLDDDGRPYQYVVAGGVTPARFLRHTFYEYDFDEPKWDDLAERARRHIGAGGLACLAGCPDTLSASPSPHGMGMRGDGARRNIRGVLSATTRAVYV